MPASEPPTTRTLGSDFRRRMFTALVGAPLVLWIVYTGGLPYALVVMVVAALAAAEFNNLIQLGRLGIVMLEFTTFACILGVAFAMPWLLLVGVFITLAVGFFESRTVEYAKMRHFGRNWAFLVAGAAYIGVPLALMLTIRTLPDGVWWVGVLFAANWATDGFALIGGRLFGRTKLAPHISPGKTIEGVWAGIIAGIAIGLAVAVPLLRLPPALSLAACVLVAVLTVLGDLLESWLKRTFKVKDSGSLLPGHGGLLDRIDGLLLAVPWLWLLLTVALP